MTPDSLVRPVIERAIDALWTQWGALGPLAGKRGRPAQAMIDPEALVLGSLGLGQYELRLLNTVSWWAHAGSTLLSVQRMKNLAGGYPDSTRERLAAFAQTAFEQGDLRWRKIAGAKGGLRSREKDLTATPRLSGDPALWLRLRLGLGVGIKADVIAFLLGMGGGQHTVPAIAKSTSYYPRALRRAVEELVAAGLVHAATTSPVSYGVVPKAWRALFEFGEDPPVWRPWGVIYEFVTALAHWAEEQPKGVTSYVLGSRARDLIDAYRGRLELALRLPRAPTGAGADSLEVFEKTLKEIADWIKVAV